MAIWFKDYTLREVSPLNTNTMMEHLDIRLTELGPDYLRGTMPVDHRTCQPYGILHGGASVTLAESLGSLAAHLCVDPEKYFCVGQAINANHIRPAKTGRVTGTARPIHRGRTSQVWSIEVHDESGNLICISRITMAVVPKANLDLQRDNT